MYNKNWAQSGYLYVKDLFDRNGGFVSEKDVTQKLKSSQNWMVEYLIIKKIILKVSLHFDTLFTMFTNIKRSLSMYAFGKTFNLKSIKCKDFYYVLIRKIFTRAHMESIWEKQFDLPRNVANWRVIYQRKVVNIPVKKIAEFNYKLLLNILATASVVSKWNPKLKSDCLRCEKPMTPKHLLFECEKTKLLWSKLERAINIDLTWKQCVIGITGTNLIARSYNLCISLCLYAIYALWVRCSAETMCYEDQNVYVNVKSKLELWSTVLSKTQSHKELGQALEIIVKEF